MNTQRITREDLRCAVASFERALRTYGMIDPSESIGLDIGSKTYGNAYRVWLRKPEGSGHYETPVVRCSGFLGMTARDAYDRLTSTTSTIHDVMYSVDRHERHEVTS